MQDLGDKPAHEESERQRGKGDLSVGHGLASLILASVAQIGCGSSHVQVPPTEPLPGHSITVGLLDYPIGACAAEEHR